MSGADAQAPTAELLVYAYTRGIFPMSFPETGTIEWFDPHPRAILPLDDRFHVPRSLQRVVRSGRFDIATDRAFEEVMRRCADPRPGQEHGTWIDDRLVRAYVDLHRQGCAHSVEAWRDGRLVGGLYGVHLGAAFFGESMFVCGDLEGRDASKVCLVHLVQHLRQRGFALLDTQFTNDHLRQFGVLEISRSQYRRRLRTALERDAPWAPFTA